MQPEMAAQIRDAAGRAQVDAAATPLARLTFAERLNFLCTNRIPRRFLTLLAGRFARLRNPLVRKLSIATWQLFVDDLRLFEAKKQAFDSLHDCFIRELRPEARPVDRDPAVVVSPCDAVVGEFGIVRRQEVLQAKGFPYSVAELLSDEALAAELEGARYVTLRLKSSMYHRFHAPCAASIHRIRYISGDTWNVNPVALKVVERLFCRNERAVIELDPEHIRARVVMVPVAAVLVASMRFHGVPQPLDLRYRGPNEIPYRRRLNKGEELGWFEHGSTIVLFVHGDFEFPASMASGDTIRMGMPLLREIETSGSRF